MGNRLKDRVAVVTGSGQGIGKAIALALAKEGAKVVTNNRRPGTEGGDAETVAKEIKAMGGEAVPFFGSISEFDVAEKLIQTAVDSFGRVDILVNNAGVQVVKEIAETSLEDWHGLMSVNLDGVFLGTKHAIRTMKESGGGSIVNISSVAGIIGTADDTAAYCASKGGVRLFTKAAALECSKMGHNYSIRVNSVHPGIIKTDMVASMMAKDAELKKRLESNMPIGFLGEPIDIAYAVLYLASDESRLVTGAELIVDGGWTAG